MFFPRPLLPVVLVAFLALASGARANVVINEIMYRPGTSVPFTVENTGREFIELCNTAATPVSIAGWALTSGVNYTFPPGATIPGNGFVVVGGDPAAVQARYGIAGVFGPWAAGGTLSNSGEKITLSKPGVAPGTFEEVDAVSYASEGDWATRVLETVYNGWDWTTPANGGDKSMELQNPNISNDNGQNWTPSVAPAGATPGVPNSVLTANVPPIVTNVKHSPAVPKSTDNVTISCRLTDETAAAGLAATLYWRDATGTSPAEFQSQAMTVDGTGLFSTVLGPKANLTIVEFYISASDGVNTRTWPAPTSEGQDANCQYQVTNEALTSTDPYYFLVLTGPENAAYNAAAPNDGIGSINDRQFNTTLVVSTGTGSTIRYRSQIRFRGNSSRSYMFKPLRVSIPGDDSWDGMTVFNLNPKASHLQFLGMRMLQAAGVRAPDSIPVRPRRNGVEYTTSTGGTPDFGRWAREEDLNGDFIDNHYPAAKGGGLYKKGRPDQYWRNTGWSVPTDPSGEIDGWSKQNNSSANDWTDLTGFFASIQSVTAPHFPGAPANNSANANGNALTGVGSWNSTPFSAGEMTTLDTVADVDQWARWFAVMTILMDFETNISNGQDDDYGIYFAPDGLGHRRANLVTHDMDTIFGLGDTTAAFNAVGLYDMTADSSVFRPLLPLLGNNTVVGNAAFRAKYHGFLRELFGTIFNADTAGNANPAFYQFVDSHLAGWASTGTINAIKTFATSRQGHLLTLLGGTSTTPPAATSTATVTSTPGTLMISEVLAANVTAHQNGTSFPDVIELYNSSASPVSLVGKSLTDDPLVKAKYVFPVGTTIPGNSYLVVYADPPASGLHTGFGLDAQGDAVYLYDTVANGQTQLDAIVFGVQIPDYSIGRTGAAKDTWALCTPTIGGANTAVAALGAPGGVVINEWAGNHDYLLPNDFLELYNPAAQPVALGGMTLTDDFINYSAKFALPQLSFIGPTAFVRFDALGGSANPGRATELPFSIDADVGWLALIGQNGTIVDRVDIVAQPQDTSRGRTTDGGTGNTTFSLPVNLPTPGLSNSTIPANILALMNGLRISEVMFKPNNLEFIELHNNGPTPLDLSGVRLLHGVDYTFPTDIPGGIVLGPGALIVVCKDTTGFQAQYGMNVPLAPGNFAGALDNSGETIELRPPAPWDINILNFAYDPNWFPVEVVTGNSSLVVIDDTNTPARDWDQKSTWMPSQIAYGTPGIPPPPIITSAGSVSSFLDTPFTYQITATNGPISYNATGLPNTLSVNTGTGAITGTLTQPGTYNITLSATNGGGTGTKPFTLTAFTSGPLASFAWSTIPVSQQAGIPFAATLTAIDAQGRTVTSFNSNAILSASAPSAVGKVLITECTIASVDAWELQNVSNAAVNTTGWFMVMNNNGGVNSTHNTYALPASLAAGEVFFRSEDIFDGGHYIGFGINWGAGGPNWAMLVDNVGKIRDFVAWGYSANQIATINVTANGFTLNPVMQGAWSGAGEVISSNYTNSEALLRSGTDDHHNDTDVARGASSLGTQNSGLTVPFPSTVFIATSPASVPCTNGVFTGNISAVGVANSIRITASDGAGHTGLTNTFNTTAPAAPVIVSPTSISAAVGQPFSYQIVATSSITVYGATNLPAGLTFNTSTGLISGLPTGAGTNSVGLSAANFSGTATATLALEVQDDADIDGMGDAWETAHGLNPLTAADAVLDRDGDGQNNLAEWLAGTLPDSAASRFRVTSTQFVGTDLQIAWTATPGKRYRVMMRPDLLTGAWTEVTPAPIPATAATATFTHPGGATGGKRFYRVEIVP